MPTRSPRPTARSARGLAPLLAALAAAALPACAESARRASGDTTVARVGAAVDSSGGAAGASAAAAPARALPTVDSAEAARRATAVDTLPLAAGAPAPGAVKRDSARAPGDTTKRRAVSGLLGPKSGARHMAFGDVGSDLDSLWPVKGPAPLPGSILPAKRIVAYYGNPLSKRMGILGELPPDSMLARLDQEVAAWTRLDPAHPAQPALHVIVLTADPHPGTSGKYRTRHDSALIEKVYGWARSRNALMFVDLQVGQSTLKDELPWIEKFLVRPDVHLGIDPEFSMKNGGVPGKRIGTYDAEDVNYASRWLAELVDRHKLPPKILVVHRFTQAGVTNARKIRLDPRVQVVMHMDGFGPPWMKRDSYWSFVKREPVQFTGWKQFTKAKNDRPPTPRADILRLWPAPLYIQVQ